MNLLSLLIPCLLTRLERETKLPTRLATSKTRIGYVDAVQTARILMISSMFLAMMRMSLCLPAVQCRIYGPRSSTRSAPWYRQQKFKAFRSECSGVCLRCLTFTSLMPSDSALSRQVYTPESTVCSLSRRRYHDDFVTDVWRGCLCGPGPSDA